MIVVRAPLRISLFGGGTDLPGYFQNREFGTVLSYSINRFVYVGIHPLYKGRGYLLKYSRVEECLEIDEIQHPIIREVLKKYGIFGIELTVSADVPAGTGMGSSSAFTVALIAAVRRFKRFSISEFEVAREACEIEINLLGAPIGYQDQFASAIGGINQLEFKSSGVRILKSWKGQEFIEILNKSVVLAEIGNSRSANAILSDQSNRIKLNSNNINSTLDQMKELTFKAVEKIENQDFNLGPLILESWNLKKELSPMISTPEIDLRVKQGLQNGAEGVKIGGAGAGGFLIFWVNPSNQSNFREYLNDSGIHSIAPEVSEKGLEVLIDD